MLVSRVQKNLEEVNTLPENFFNPSRLPGEPPWLRTLPPARFVAVRTEPRPDKK
jgi:hypothetical protein